MACWGSKPPHLAPRFRRIYKSMTPSGVNAHNMTVTDLDFDGWTVTTFEEPVPGNEQTFDRVMAMEVPGGVALCVADAAVNIADPDHEAKTAFALRTVVDDIAAHGIEAGLDHTAETIHDPDQPLRHRNGMLTFAGVHIDDNGSIQAFRCGDSEIWARFGSIWLEVLPGDTLTPRGRELYERVTVPGSIYDNWVAQERVLDDLDLWESPPLGLDSVVRPQQKFLSSADEIVVSSDGARLNAARVAGLDKWLNRYIHVMPDNHPYAAAHGDISVIRAVRDQ